MALEAEQILNNRYRIIKLLGQGGFGEVYQAWDMRLEGYCAVKRNLQPAPAVRRQFEQEAKMLFKLRHPNLPRVQDYFTGAEDEQYLVMDFIDGEDLRERLKRSGAVPLEQALFWLDQICDALVYLHTSEPPVVHRDIKPANIIITPKGQAMLVDFGIAKADPQMRTIAGARAWTPGFAPPEQYGQERTDAQSDVYSLGATAYALLTGEAPPDAMDVAAGNKKPAQPAHELNPAVPLHVSKAIGKAMQYNREQRMHSVAEFRQALSAQSEPAPVIINSSDEDITIIELAPIPESESSESQSEARQMSPEPGSSKPQIESLAQSPEPGSPELRSEVLPARRKPSLMWIVGAIGALLVVIALGGLAWWNSQGGKEPVQPTSETVQEPGLPTSETEQVLEVPTSTVQVILEKIIVATDATWPPFEMLDENTKELVGFDIDLMKAIAEKAGLDIEFVNVSWDPLLSGMATCQYDASISAMTITEQRMKEFSFTEPYFAAGQIVTVRIDNTDITGKDSLPGRKVGAQLGTTGDIQGKDLGADMKSYDDIGLAFQDLMNGQIDAVIADNPLALGYVAKNADKLKTAGDVFTDENYGIAVCKNKADLVDKLNIGLKAVKDEGLVDILIDKWLK
jgi:ABC-type amino acid transport substrate-binding protein/predicted Ser/Thr protein kinase